MKKQKTEKFDLEALFHLVVHFLGILLILWLTIYPPVWISVLAIILEEVQMKFFGRCVLTVIAHKRGYMRGKTYWQYVPWLLGVKDYKRADKIISSLITYTIIGILLVRIIVGLI